MRILVTGAGGQLGSELIGVLAQDEVHGLDHGALDISDREAVFAAVDRVRPSWIINAAAFNEVDAAEGAPEQAFQVNASGAGYLAEAAVRAGADMVHISTDYVFDGRKGAPYTELDHANPLSVYGRSKYEGELQVLNSHASACVLRTAWLYGRYGKNYVKAILAAAEGGGPLKVVADQVGSPTWTRHLASSMWRTAAPAAGLSLPRRLSMAASMCCRLPRARLDGRRHVRQIARSPANAGRRRVCHPFRIGGWR